MADQKPNQQNLSRATRDRRLDIERLAATIFGTKICSPSWSSKTPDAVAAECLKQSREFYRIIDEQDTPPG